jgi:hypothetical protein
MQVTPLSVQKGWMAATNTNNEAIFAGGYNSGAQS